jgi:hypothetical protein
MRKQLKLISDGGDSASKKCKEGYGGVWPSLHLVGVWSQAVGSVLVVLCLCWWQVKVNQVGSTFKFWLFKPWKRETSDRSQTPRLFCFQLERDNNKTLNCAAPAEQHKFFTAYTECKSELRILCVKLCSAMYYTFSSIDLFFVLLFFNISGLVALNDTTICNLYQRFVGTCCLHI